MQNISICLFIQKHLEPFLFSSPRYVYFFCVHIWFQVYLLVYSLVAGDESFYIQTIAIHFQMLSSFAVFMCVMFLYRWQTKFWGLYRTHPVRLSIFLVSATCPKLLNQYWWNFTHLQYTTWGCAWRRIIQVQKISREIILGILVLRDWGYSFVIWLTILICAVWEFVPLLFSVANISICQYVFYDYGKQSSILFFLHFEIYTLITNLWPFHCLDIFFKKFISKSNFLCYLLSSAWIKDTSYLYWYLKLLLNLIILYGVLFSVIIFYLIWKLCN